MATPNTKSIRIRSNLILGFFLLLLLAVMVRLFWLGVWNHKFLLEKSQRQYDSFIEVASRRGNIYDRQGRDLAVSLQVESLFAVPSQIKSPVIAAQHLSPVLQLPATEISQKLAHSKGFVWLKRRMPPKEVEEVKNLNLPGLFFTKESKRFYPHKELAAHLVGFTSVDDVGQEGAEFQFEQYLKGGRAKIPALRDALGRAIVPAGWQGRDQSQGQNLILTIDQVIQNIAERHLQAAISQYSALGGTIIVTNPKTGEILALANQPTFNANNHMDYNPTAYRNRAISHLYEPGSTFKLVVTVGALEEKAAKVVDKFYCEQGTIEIAGVTIRDHDKYGWLTFSKVIEQSSNVGTIKIGRRLGPARLYKYIQELGFGQKTGIELPGEASGLLKSPAHWSALSPATMSIGQEVAITPLQLAMAYGAAANGGYLMKPQIVKSLQEPGGKIIKENTPQTIRRVMSTETYQTLLPILEGVVRWGTGAKAQVPGYVAAGKTGTAQKTDPTTGRYSQIRGVASFVGFVPSRNPKILILVVIDEPKAGHGWGGTVAAPVFREVAKETLIYLGVAPQEPLKYQLAQQTGPGDKN